jgi:hypothetical protein
MTDLFPAAQAVLQAATVQACLAEWGAVNDPPCHPDDEDWNGCHLCVKRDLIAAALRAAADQAVPSDADEPRNYLPMAIECQRIREELLAIAAELEALDD